MASPFRVFRKYLKPLMVVFGVMIMFVFVILDPMAAYLGGSRGVGGRDPGVDADAVAVSWEGGSLTNSELNNLVMRRRILNSFLIGVERAGAFAAMEAGADPRELQTPPVNRLTGPGTPQEGVEQSVLQTRLFSQAARDAGMRVSDEAIVTYLDALGRNRVSRDNMRAMLSQLPARVSIDYIFDALRDEMLAHNYLTGYQFAFETVTPHQRFQDWLKLNDRIVVEAAAIPVESFVVDVPQPKEAELTAFFNEHKEREPQPDFIGPMELPSPTPGFRIPRKIDVQFIEANYDEFLNQAESQVTDKEIAKYYEENKEQFIKADTGLFDAPPTTEAAEATSPTDQSADQVDAPAGATRPAETQNTDATESESATDQPADAAPPSDNQSPGNEPTADEVDETVETSADETGNEGAVDESAPAESDQSFRGMIRGSAFALAALLQQPATDAAANEDSTDQAANDAATDASAQSQDNEATAEDAVVEPPTDAAAPATDNQPAAGDATAEADPSTPPSDQPADAAAADASPAAEEPPQEYQPLEEVSDEIRRTIARARVTEQLSELMNRLHSEVNAEFNEYYSARLDAEAQERQAPAPSPELADLAPLAQQHGLQHGRTGPKSWLELRETPVGKSGEIETQFPLWRILFFGGDEHDLYQPISTQDIDANRFLVTKTSDTPGRVPELTEVREEVVQAWKRTKAADLALEHAEAEAKKAQENRSPLADYFANQPGIEVVTSDPFSRYTGGDVGIVNQQLQREPLRLSQPDNIFAPGPEFMDEVFALKDGEVGAVLSHDHSIAYVVRVAERQMSPEELRTAYLSEAAYWPGMEVMISDRFRASAQLLAADILKSVNVDWKRPADELEQDEEE